jgi:hypothetical protein
MSKLFLHFYIYTWYILNLFRGSATLLLTKYEAHPVLAHRVGFSNCGGRILPAAIIGVRFVSSQDIPVYLMHPTSATPTTSAVLVFLPVV